MATISITNLILLLIILLFLFFSFACLLLSFVILIFSRLIMKLAQPSPVELNELILSGKAVFIIYDIFFLLLLFWYSKKIQILKAQIVILI